MSNTIEDLLYSAHVHSKREDLLRYVTSIREANPNTELVDLYQMAYEHVMNA